MFSTYVEVIPYIQSSGAVGQQKCSPRMWRWSWATRWWWVLLIVFSTYVEVILKHHQITLLIRRVLHVCGGDPNSRINLTVIERCSPRMWKQVFNMSSEQLIYRILSCRFFNFCLTIKSFESKIIKRFWKADESIRFYYRELLLDEKHINELDEHGLGYQC